MASDAGSADERLSRPCRVDSLATTVPNMKAVNAATFGFISNLATEHTRQIQSDTAADVEEAQTSQAAAGALDPQSLCTESQVTFTVPPMTPFPFHVRFRVDVDGRKGPWENPLTWEGGYFFSPRMKGGLGNVTMPPPVLLSVEWERSNIEGKWTWQ
ncbi:unnamed protein product, partial [Polarella glacialis]